MAGRSLAAGQGRLILQAQAVAFAFPRLVAGKAETDSPRLPDLQPVTFSVSAGEIVHVSGASGCGKSTLARCLAGLIPHLYHGQLQGDVCVNGLRTDQAPLWQISEQAGLVFQNPAGQMLAGSVEDEIIFGLENLGLPADEIDRRLKQALSDFGLEALRLRPPQTLSGGEQQKLALAAITARRPPLLVLDEPLSMLDPSTAFDFVDLLGRLAANGAAVVICEHRAGFLADLPGLRTLELDNNRVAPGQISDGALSSSVPQLPTWAPAPATALELRARGLRVRLGKHQVLDGLNFNLHGGQVTAIVGRNGTGKTTLLRALAGLQACEGQVEVRVDSRSEKPALGLVFQNPDLQFFNASVRAEILYRLPYPNLERYQDLLAAVDLQRYENTPPLLLSEGEKRRLALAMTLMRQPPHGLLLDEPALGQDSRHKEQLVSLLRQVADSGRMVAFTTHDIELAARADRLLLLGSQGLLADGPPAAALAQAQAWETAGLRIPPWVQP